MEIKGSVVLVTGGAKGLGLAIAKFLQAQGAKVIVVDLDKEALSSLPDKLKGYQLDVTSPNDVNAVINTIIEQHGQIETLINNAGVIYSEPMINIMKATDRMHDYNHYRQSIAVNMDSVFIMSSAIIEQMVMTRTKGCIINISSISACGNEGQTAYSAAKAGVNAMTVTWSKELGRLGLRCNAISPGFINTDSTNTALNDSTIKHIVNNTPLRRLGEANEIAQTVVSLIENNFINGQIINVNGGLTI